MTIEGRLTSIMPISAIDTTKYLIEQEHLAAGSDEEDLDMGDDDSLMGGAHGAKFKITNIKKGKSLTEGSKVKVVITEMIVNQGNMVLYAKFP